MTVYYVPYAGNKPASLSINGHSLLILAQEPEELKANLDAVGADNVRRVVVSSKAEREVKFSKLARRAKAGLVIAPAELPVGEVIRNLENELPWIQ